MQAAHLSSKPGDARLARTGELGKVLEQERVRGPKTKMRQYLVSAFCGGQPCPPPHCQSSFPPGWVPFGEPKKKKDPQQKKVWPLAGSGEQWATVSNGFYFVQASPLVLSSFEPAALQLPEEDGVDERPLTVDRPNKAGTRNVGGRLPRKERRGTGSTECTESTYDVDDWPSGGARRKGCTHRQPGKLSESIDWKREEKKRRGEKEGRKGAQPNAGRGCDCDERIQWLPKHASSFSAVRRRVPGRSCPVSQHCSALSPGADLPRRCPTWFVACFSGRMRTSHSCLSFPSFWG